MTSMHGSWIFFLQLDPGFFSMDLFLTLSKEHHYSKSCMLAWIHNFQILTKYCWFTCNLKGRGDRNRHSVTICVSVVSSECVLARMSSSYGQGVSVCCSNKVSDCLREYKATVIQHSSAVSCPRNYGWRSTSSGVGECEHWWVNVWFCQQLELKSIL